MVHSQLFFCLLALVVSDAAEVKLPFGQAALKVSQLEDLKACEKVKYSSASDSDDCDNPMAAVDVWAYVLTNLDRALSYGQDMPDGVTATSTRLHSVLQQFFAKANDKTYKALMRDFRAAFSDGDLLRWLNSQDPAPIGAQEDAILVRGTEVVKAATSGDGLSRRGDSLSNTAVQLADGKWMPLVGFGTWQLEGKACVKAVKSALSAGYRHIDTAQAYGNEAQVGKAIAESGVAREDIFLATKISDSKDYKKSRLASVFEKQLKKLGTSYVDLYMLHGVAEGANHRALTLEAWRELEKLHDQGKARSIGISNFDPSQLKELLKNARVAPVYLQNKFSIYSHDGGEGSTSVLPRLLRERKVAHVGYSIINPYPALLSPLHDAHVIHIAKRLNVTPSQLLHRWAIQLGVAVLPKSQNEARIVENGDLFGFNIEDQDMAVLSGLIALVGTEREKNPVMAGGESDDADGESDDTDAREEEEEEDEQGEEDDGEQEGEADEDENNENEDDQSEL